MVTQLEHTLIAYGLINIYIRQSNLVEIMQKLLFTISLRVCFYGLIAKVIIIRYFLRYVITPMMELISNIRIDLQNIRIGIYIVNKPHALGRF